MARYKSNKLNWPVFWISGILAYMGWHFLIPALFWYSIITFVFFTAIILSNKLDNMIEDERRGRDELANFRYEDEE